MSSPTAADLTSRRRIVVADEDPEIVEFHAYDGLAAAELVFALDECHLLITNTRVSGLPGIQLVYMIRNQLPNLPIMYIANIDRSTPAIEAKLPRDVPIIREPFTAADLRSVVQPLLADERSHGVDMGETRSI